MRTAQESGNSQGKYIVCSEWLNDLDNWKQGMKGIQNLRELQKKTKFKYKQF